MLVTVHACLSSECTFSLRLRSTLASLLKICTYTGLMRRRGQRYV